MKNTLQKEWKNYKVLMRNIPAVVVALYCVSVVGMNLMANKIIFNSAIVSADGGILLSWIPFLCMDMIIKRYGAKAAVEINIVSLLINILFSILFSIVASVQIDVGISYSQGDIYESFNSVFDATWFVVLGSSLASFCSAVMNSFSNVSVGKLFKKNPDSKLAFFVRSYISTFLAQFIDNLVFAVTVFMIFAPIYWGYSLQFVQCVGAGILGAILELIMEVIFSPFGYKIVKKWEQEGIGSKYLEFIKQG